MSEHTPGPWQWWTSNSWLRLTGPDGRDGGVLYPYNTPSNRHPHLCVSAPDMLLIQAAPEMYEALKAARDRLTFYNTDEEVEDMIEAAIAKAEGRNDE